METSSILGAIRLSIRVGYLGGKIWHEVIEFFNRHIDRALFDQPWAWSNSKRYHQ